MCSVAVWLTLRYVGVTPPLPKKLPSCPRSSRILWKKALTDEFNEIVLKNILNDKFDASKANCAVVGTGIEQFLPPPVEEATAGGV